jgi:hypothetical protein
MSDDKRVRPSFMGVGYHDEVDASAFIEMGREHGVIDLSEDEEQAHKKKLDEAKKVNLASTSMKVIEAAERLAGYLNDLSNIQDGSVLTPKTRKRIRSSMDKVSNAMAMYGHEILPKLK